MAGRLSYWKYLKAAFNARPHIRGLGHLPVNKILMAGFTILGIASPGFLFVGAAFETAYLMLLTSNRRFQRLVEAGVFDRKAVTNNPTIDSYVGTLEGAGQARFKKLETRCNQLLQLGKDFDSPDTSLAEMKTSGVNRLLWIFLQLLRSQQLIAHNLKNVDQQRMLADIREMEMRLKREDLSDSVKRSLESTIVIKRRRMENMEKAAETMQVISAELDRIEEQVELLREEAVVNRDPTFLSDQLDMVSGTLADTISWMDKQEELFRSIDEDLIPPPPIVNEAE